MLSKFFTSHHNKSLYRHKTVPTTLQIFYPKYPISNEQSFAMKLITRRCNATSHEN